MITYDRSPFGVNLLFRFSGSAIYRATIPGLFTVVFFILIREFGITDSKVIQTTGDLQVRHPYAVGILVGSISFLLVFRVQIAYARYWEAISAVHHFMSKWMDATMHTACFHMQCSHYDSIKPPSFFDHPELNAHCLSFARERHSTDDELDESERVAHRAFVKSIERVESGKKGRVNPRQTSTRFVRAPAPSMEIEPVSIDPVPRFDGNWGNLFPDGKATYFHPRHPEQKDPQGFASHQGGRTPPLFLQELAHLTSLMTGVALATLRNDIEGAESPLDIYYPGSPWPEVDPNLVHDSMNTKWGVDISQVSANVLYYLGMGRSPAERTKYNASRPLPVIGGVSAAEIRFLQMARGPYAKTQLCWVWLSEFITREHLAGTLGKVGPPIISRIIQFLGDGMIYYNHARKVMFIPFPFPHAQLSAYYVMLALPAIALLMDQYTDDVWLGVILSFLTATCLAGINEVARELENPFRNIPNELPLVTLQAQFNEALITMYAGYHPDHFWEEETSPYSASSPYAKSKVKKPASSSVPNGPTKATAAGGGGVASAAAAAATPNGSVEMQVQELLKKINEQGEELERLRTAMSSDDKEDRKKR